MFWNLHQAKDDLQCAAAESGRRERAIKSHLYASIAHPKLIDGPHVLASDVGECASRITSDHHSGGILMKDFPLFAAFSVGLSLGSLRTSFDELWQKPFILGADARKVAFGAADEGMLDSELSSEDPVAAWLGRYLTPPRD
jgi:hypothetical protein